MACCIPRGNCRCVIGQYKPTDAGTAHMRLAKTAGMTNPVVGGSVKKDGKIELRFVCRVRAGRIRRVAADPGRHRHRLTDSLIGF